jgi:hypothetical protein
MTRWQCYGQTADLATLNHFEMMGERQDVVVAEELLCRVQGVKCALDKRHQRGPQLGLKN